MKTKILILSIMMCSTMMFAQEKEVKIAEQSLDTINSFEISLNTLSIDKGFEKVNSPKVKLSNFEGEEFYMDNSQPLLRKSRNSPLSSSEFSYVVYKTISKPANASGAIESKND